MKIIVGIKGREGEYLVHRVGKYKVVIDAYGDTIGSGLQYIDHANLYLIRKEEG